MERVDHLGCFRQDDRVHRRVGGRHVEGAEADPFLPGLRLAVDKAGDLGVVAARQDVDDLVVLHVGDGGVNAAVIP